MSLFSSMRFSSPPKPSIGVDTFTPTSAVTAFNDEQDIDGSSTTNIIEIHHDHWQEFPESVQFRIIQLLSPLAQYMCVSKSFDSSIKAYIFLRSRTFKESREEASTWGHKATQLHEVLHFDPLLVQGIVTTAYDPVNSTIGSLSKEGIENSLPQLQRHIFKSIEVALYDYTICWGSIVPLIAIARKYRLDHIPYTTRNAASTQVLDDQTEITTNSLDTIESKDSTEEALGYVGFKGARDVSWIGFNDKLYMLASSHGHVFNLPGYYSVFPESVAMLQKKAMRNFVKCACAIGVFEVAERARACGAFFDVLLKGLKTSLKATRQLYVEEDAAVNRGKRCKVALLLLGYAMNDSDGPYARRDMFHELGKDIISKAMELNECLDLSFRYNAKLGRFAVMHVNDALRITLNKSHGL